MATPNWIAIPPSMNLTLTVAGAFPYYIQMGQGSTLTVHGKNGGACRLKDVWGPGNLNIASGSISMGSIGSVPSGLTQNCYTCNKANMEYPGDFP